MTKPSQISFVKYSATGNDFILIDNRNLALTANDKPLFQNLCQRRTSVGADGVLLVENDDEYDFRLRYFNADGSETECGNGARSAAHYTFHNQISESPMSFRFGDAIYEAEVMENRVKLRMPGPRHLQDVAGITRGKNLTAAGFVHIGVPHFVLFCEDISELNVVDIGREYRHHMTFQPDGANIDFVQILSDNKISVRTYERGVENETLSCGTGCVASGLLAHLKKNVKYPIDVMTRGGTLVVSRNGDNLYLEGEVKPVYRAEILF